jgi:hypothetical protein
MKIDGDEEGEEEHTPTVIEGLEGVRAPRVCWAELEDDRGFQCLRHRRGRGTLLVGVWRGHLSRPHRQLGPALA